MKNLTTFIIPTIGRDTLQRAIDSCKDQAPYLVGVDKKREGAAKVRNRLIRQAQSPWVSFLDDDDTVTADYVKRLAEEAEKHPEADVIVFKEYFIWGEIIPKFPTCGWGNIGIAFSVKKEAALKHPFRSIRYEDFEFVHTLEKEGYNIHFSNYLTYHGRH